jgi:hypothetical protein
LPSPESSSQSSTQSSGTRPHGNQKTLDPKHSRFSPERREEMNVVFYIPLSLVEKGPIAQQWEERPLQR